MSSVRMPQPDEKERTLNLFPGSHHQALNNTDFRVAGRDIFTPTIAPTINVNVTASGPASDWTHSSGPARDTMGPPPVPISTRQQNHRSRSPHLAISLPVQKFGNHSRLPSDAASRRGFTPPPSSSTSPSPRPHYPASDPPPEKVRDPRRLSGMLVSLRRLINPKTPSSPEPQSSPRGTPVRRTPQDDRGTKYGSPTPKSLHRHASWDSSTSVESRDSDFTVSSIDEPDDWNKDPPKITTPEVYVSRMLKTGRGLACWQPRPQKPLTNEGGTVPGDVGTFTAEGGFKRIFNLWEDNLLAQKVTELHKDGRPPFQLPQRNVLIAQNRLAKGDTVVQGTTGKTMYGVDNDKRIKYFEFQCRAQEGALLAITSPADLEELEDHAALREYIFQHAELIYKHSNSLRRLADEEPLYIITGCIKSETWALAAFSDPTSVNDVLELVNLGTSTGEDLFVWTDKATAEAYVGRSETTGQKDQTLFLRGFKLAFSQQFIRRMRTDLPLRPSLDQAARVTPAPGDPGHSLRDVWDFWGRSHLDGTEKSDLVFQPQGTLPKFDCDSGSQFEGPDPQPLTRQRDVYSSGHKPGEVRVVPMAPQSGRYSCHPCDIINEYILNNTEADFALSHDDDWSFLLEDPLWSDLFCSDVDDTPSDLISIRKGVAFIVDAGTEDRSKERENDIPVAAFSEAHSRGSSVKDPPIKGSCNSSQARQNISPTAACMDAPPDPVLQLPQPARSAWQLFLRDWTARQEQLGRPKLSAPQMLFEASNEYQSLSAGEQREYQRLSRAEMAVNGRKRYDAMLREDAKGVNPLWTTLSQKRAGRPRRTGRDRKPFLTRAEEEKAKYEEAYLKYEEESCSPRLPPDNRRVDSRMSKHEEKLRAKLGIESGQPISLWSLPEPEKGHRPPHPYSLLVQLAIYGSTSRHLTLNQIYRAIGDRFEYYRNQPEGSWKAEIRHSLSLNQVLRNSEGSNPLGGFWEGVQHQAPYPGPACAHRTRPQMSHYSSASTSDDSPWGPPSPESPNSDHYQSAPSSPVGAVSVLSAPDNSQTLR